MEAAGERAALACYVQSYFSSFQILWLALHDAPGKRRKEDLPLGQGRESGARGTEAPSVFNPGSLKTSRDVEGGRFQRKQACGQEYTDRQQLFPLEKIGVGTVPWPPPKSTMTKVNAEGCVCVCVWLALLLGKLGPTDMFQHDPRDPNWGRGYLWPGPIKSTVPRLF